MHEDFMRIFSDDKKKEELMLVFDIGSSSVGGALFLMQNSRVPKIIFSIRESITLQKDLNADQFLSFTIKSLDIIVNKIYMAKLGAPKRIFCVLSSPWHVSQARVIKLAKNTPFVFTSKLADSLIQKEISLFEEEHLKKYANTGSSFRSIEFKNIKTMLNGYEKKQTLKSKKKKNIKFSSFVIASFTIVRDIYINQENFLLIEIGGEVTDISMIKKNTLRESSSFPLGRNFIIRGVSSILRSSLDEAKSFISLFQNGHTALDMAKKLSPIIDKLKMEWLQKFQESLANLSNDISIPETIYMVVDKDLAGFFCETIENEQFNQYTLTESRSEE